jgi:hypothetical protein
MLFRIFFDCGRALFGISKFIVGPTFVESLRAKGANAILICDHFLLHLLRLSALRLQYLPNLTLMHATTPRKHVHEADASCSRARGREPLRLLGRMEPEA